MIAVAEKYAIDVRMPTPITSDRQHAEYLSVLQKLMDKERPSRDEEQYAQVLVTLIEAYEDKNFPIPDASPVDVLRTLMEANDLRQKDLVDIFGTASIVSDVLNGKRDLAKEHIRRLSARFHVSPAVFF